MKKYKQDKCYEIINAAIKVYNTLGYGFLESVYKKALIIELKLRGFQVEEELETVIHYKSHIVGKYFIDLMIDKEVIVELKTAVQCIKNYFKQTRHYMKAEKKKAGLLFNFSPDKLEYFRVYIERDQ